MNQYTWKQKQKCKTYIFQVKVLFKRSHVESLQWNQIKVICSSVAKLNICLRQQFASPLLLLTEIKLCKNLFWNLQQHIVCFQNGWLKRVINRDLLPQRIAIESIPRPIISFSKLIQNDNSFSGGLMISFGRF